MAGAAHALFIVQVCAKIIDSFPFKNQQLSQGGDRPCILNMIRRDNEQIEAIKTGCFHAPGKHTYRRLALSWGFA
ncbi:hypothetical protein CK516_02090 [Nostoc sp. 'Peltigera malacea cyanobiont' DB3992]|nr:hypothetical protein CK516_02090 [Nostoc sp. 'Peltigera malacea cyanobiont' DB3992]